MHRAWYVRTMNMRLKEALALAALGIAALSAAIGYRVISALPYPYTAATVTVALLFFGLAALIGAYFYARLPPVPSNAAPRPRDVDVGF